MSDYEVIGGEPALRAIIDDFVARVFEDVMIGFIFVGKNRQRIAEMEFLLASQQLGGPHPYTGRDIGEVHRRLPIMGGHFDRRRQILKNTLEAHGVPGPVVERWLAHVDSLRDEVLGAGAPDGHCDHALQEARQDGDGEEGPS
jgi:hemoglobin